ncbi:Uma2 family endonuclease [Labrys sp. LIt4]|uniref:Uma2 family endonuclease n=1 Tax=Labrys sp. LIt4 TaxID=2821355 RepID=UPI001AE075B7|nr:Uma2 family endonuclease [Labrys sp. LIt4]MBP0579640.1 Uma2 family endonuclease [Labrys sp. LIt4]
MAEVRHQPMSLDEFLAWENEQELRYELVDGQAVMMTGGTVAHDYVRSRIALALGNQLQGKPCRLALDVKIACPNGNVRYPDVAVHCGPYRPRDLLASEPRIVIEVLSDSTKATDFLIKLRDYQSVPDIAAYLIFWQDEARVLVHRRNEQAWQPGEELVGARAIVGLPEIGAELSLAEIYREIVLE